VSGKANYLSNQTLNKWLGGAAGASAPATVYLALGTACDATGLTGEPVGNGYSRTGITNNTTNFPTTSTQTKSNAVAVTTATASGNWGTLGFGALYDAASTGNMLYWGPLSVAVGPGSGQAVNFAVGTIVATES
jgi:hypothetical protein